MAWMELTNSNDDKLLVNADHLFSVEEYYAGGARIEYLMSDAKGNGLQNFNVRETKAEIEALLAKAGIVLVR